MMRRSGNDRRAADSLRLSLPSTVLARRALLSERSPVQKRAPVIAITDCRRWRRHNIRHRCQWRDVRPREMAMIKTRTGMFAAVGLLLGGVSTAALASVSKPTAEERAACMGDAMTLCITAIPNRARIASCLASKMSQLSPRCRAQFDKAASGR